MQNATKKPDIKSTFKSLDTEEPIDIYFYRPIGYWWAVLFGKLGVSPNAITIASIFIGMAAGICFYFQDIYIILAGILLLIWANMFDSADGQLARMTGQFSPIGRLLDGFSGDVWFFTIYFFVCLRLTPEWGFWIWLLGAVAGFSHTKQAATADYYRNIHLLFLKGKEGSEWANTRTLKEEYKTLSWKKNFIIKLGNIIYTNYTAGQEKLSPKFQKMMKALYGKYDETPEWFREAFRAKSLPLMKYANMLSFNTRVIALFVSLLINIPWLYFVFELTVLNSMLVYMVVTHERFCADFTKQIES